MNPSEDDRTGIGICLYNADSPNQRWRHASRVMTREAPPASLVPRRLATERSECIRKRCSSFCVLLRHGFFRIIPHYSAFFCFYLFLLIFLSLILKKVEKGLQNVAKAEKAMPPYPFASFFSVLK